MKLVLMDEKKTDTGRKKMECWETPEDEGQKDRKYRSRLCTFVEEYHKPAEKKPEEKGGQ